jgi:hypothetical protein
MIFRDRLNIKVSFYLKSIQSEVLSFEDQIFIQDMMIYDLTVNAHFLNNFY